MMFSVVTKVKRPLVYDRARNVAFGVAENFRAFPRGGGRPVNPDPEVAECCAALWEIDWCGGGGGCGFSGLWWKGPCFFSGSGWV